MYYKSINDAKQIALYGTLIDNNIYLKNKIFS